MSFDNETLEKAARGIIQSMSQGKCDPDMLVQPGTPNVYGTPSGDVFAVTKDAGVPLWRMYLPTARTLLEMTQGIVTEKAA